MSTSDKYSAAPDVTGDAIFACNSNNWAAILKHGVVGTQINFGTIWANNGTGKIGGWNIGFSDRYLYFKPGYESYLLAINPNGFAGVYRLWGSSSVTNLWFNNGSGYIGRWSIGSNDKYFAGFFDPLHQYQDILIISQPWAALLRFTGNQWQVVWNNQGSGYIGGWNINLADQFVIGDLDGDGKDEILAEATFGNYAAIIKYINGNMQAYWGNGGNNYIGSWLTNYQDKYLIGNIDNVGNRQKFFAANSSSNWASLQRFSGGGWAGVWANGGSGYFGGWQLGAGDRYLKYHSAYFQKEYILAITPNWCTMSWYISVTEEPIAID